MTATVVSLDSRRPRPQTTAGCSACRRDSDGVLRECYPHRLNSLALRLRTQLNTTAAELLIDRDLFATTLDDALEVIQGITAECLPEAERSSR